MGTHRAAATTAAHTGPHLYLVAESGSAGPMKIGVNHHAPHMAGRNGLQSGNPRRLVVLARRFGDEADVRWREFVAHQRLRDRHSGVGEWFHVSDLVPDNRWDEFLTALTNGGLPTLPQWRLGDDSHHLVAMKRRSFQPRRFDAVCSCGATLEGPTGKTMPTVISMFGVEHLHMDPRARALLEIRRGLTDSAGSDGAHERPEDC